MVIPEDIVSEMRKIHKKEAEKTEIYTETDGSFCGIFQAHVFRKDGTAGEYHRSFRRGVNRPTNRKCVDHLRG